MFRYFLIFFFFAFYSLQAQSVASIRLVNTERNDSNPVMELNQKMVLSFDILNQNHTSLQYKITRYNANWEKSNAFDSEFLTGFSSNRIKNYQNSFNTRQIYTHYKLEIPNQDFKITLSGNYKIEVLNQGKTLFSRRFIVYENLASIGLKVQRFPHADSANQKVEAHIYSQNIDFTKNQAHQLLIYKNNQLNNHFIIKEASFTQNHQMQFVQNNLRFQGGVEYQFFDTKNLNIASLTTQNIIADSIYQTILYPVKFNPDLPYLDRPDVNGNFYPRVLHGNRELSASTQADYTRVYFALDAPLLALDSKVCIFGAFNNFECSEDDFLTYDTPSGYWVTNRLLKQGYYNYSFALVEDNSLKPEKITGSFWETENEYSAILYYRPWGSRYDLAVGFGEGFSRESQYFKP